MNGTIADLRHEIRQLAEEAFHRKLISGYGDGQNNNEFQVVYNGKPRHLSLQEAYSFLNKLLK